MFGEVVLGRVWKALLGIFFGIWLVAGLAAFPLVFYLLRRKTSWGKGKNFIVAMLISLSVGYGVSSAVFEYEGGVERGVWQKTQDFSKKMQKEYLILNVELDRLDSRKINVTLKVPRDGRYIIQVSDLIKRELGYVRDDFDLRAGSNVVGIRLAEDITSDMVNLDLTLKIYPKDSNGGVYDQGFTLIMPRSGVRIKREGMIYVAPIMEYTCSTLSQNEDPPCAASSELMVLLK